MNQKIIIWDWNGTLLDDVRYCTDIINKFLKKYGLKQITVEQYRQIFTFPVKKYYEKLGFDFKKISFEKIGIEFISEYEKNFYRLKLRKNAVEILNLIKKQKIRQGIISARKQTALIKDVKYFSIEKYFDFIIGIDDDLAHGKEHIFERFVSTNKGKKILIGDTEYDYSLAHKYNIEIILVKKGHNSDDRLLKTNAVVVDNLKAVYELLQIF